MGQGSFALVKQATHKEQGVKYAVKIINKQQMNKEDPGYLKAEVEVMMSISHENIVGLKECFDCTRKFYMILDLCTGGELFDRIVFKQFYTEDEARKCLLQVNSALHHCHEKKIVHRDLKPENLLYFRPEPDETIKLVDFGLAYILDKETMLTQACGTPGYVAPEVLTGEGYGVEADMWSLGVILYILLCGFPPFYDDSNYVLFEIIKEGTYEFPSPYWDDVSKEATDLITKLLTVDPLKRATTTDVMNHPWMQSAEGKNKHLQYFNKNMSAYNARRKFRGVIMGMQVLSLMKAGGGLSATLRPEAGSSASQQDQQQEADTKDPQQPVGPMVAPQAAADNKEPGPSKPQAEEDTGEAASSS